MVSHLPWTQRHPAWTERHLIFMGEDPRLIFHRKQTWQRLIEIIGETSLLIDLGCGSGVLIRLLEKAQSGLFTVGLDCDVEKLHAASKSSVGNFVCASVSALPFKNKVADVITATMVMEHVDDKTLLGEMWRVLKEDGKILVTTVIRTPRAWSIYKDAEGNPISAPDHLREYPSVTSITEIIVSRRFEPKLIVHSPLRFSVVTFLLALMYRVHPHRILRSLASNSTITKLRATICVPIPHYFEAEIIAQKRTNGKPS